MTEEDKADVKVLHHTTAIISIEGKGPNAGGDVTLEVVERSGGYVGVVMQQKEDDDDLINVIDLTLSQRDFLRFLTLSHALLSVAVEAEDD